MPLVVEHEPDVVLLDVHMPGGGGLEVIRRPRGRRPAQRFLALSVSDAPEDVIAIIRAGARGYVTKTISGAELADAVRRVADGDAVFSPRLAGLRARRVRLADARSRSTRSSTSSPRASARSCATSPAATSTRRSPPRLGISAKTVEAHVSSVLRKLQLSTRHELSRWAVERRLVD